ncbi:MAG: STAS domain-containing protein [Silvibacterium sp.]
MSLTMESRFCGNVYVIQCTGRIVAGEEERALEAALEQRGRECPRFVLNLSAVTRLDSIGLGLLVRHSTRLNKCGGAIRLAAPSAPVVNLLNLTNLTGVLKYYPTDEDAVLSFMNRHASPTANGKGGARLLVFDQSPNLCMFVQTLLAQHGFDVRTVCSFRDAKILLRTDHVDYILVGPCTPQLSAETVIRELSALAPKASALQLGADFKSHDAVEATQTLLQMLGVSAS